MDNCKNSHECDVSISLLLSLDQLKVIFVALDNMNEVILEFFFFSNVDNLSKEERKHFEDLRSKSDFLLSAFDKIFSSIEDEGIEIE